MPTPRHRAPAPFTVIPLLLVALLAGLGVAQLVGAPTIAAPASAALTPYEGPVARLVADERPLVVAHRGSAANAPENTLPAFQGTLAAGATIIEADLRQTRDGRIVVIHDTAVDRTSNGTGEVSELSFARLRSLDAGGWFGPSYVGTRIPTLDELLDVVAANAATVILELKGVWDETAVAEVRGAVRDRHLDDQTVIASFTLRSLLAAQEVMPEIPRMLLTETLSSSRLADARDLEVAAIGTSLDALDTAPGALDAIRLTEVAVALYTLDDSQSWARAVALGVDVIITDNAPGLTAWLNARS